VSPAPAAELAWQPTRVRLLIAGNQVLLPTPSGDVARTIDHPELRLRVLLDEPPPGEPADLDLDIGAWRAHRPGAAVTVGGVARTVTGRETFVRLHLRPDPANPAVPVVVDFGDDAIVRARRARPPLRGGPLTPEQLDAIEDTYDTPGAANG
jgi:hypothetical protein